ncbi:trifunctional serine/threonine-protein kinase/ATP-binding protein/sensor histidine kinase [Roseateles depolymerans]|uniref:histidine kinase n=1 Tax=Roseateles depolymerans TaxID=76731 RepID=A0A0U3E5G4_9BURK|nr:ATP-binding sensor histidine kinase [Roseateles depolymerans]ALV08533.1 Histidine kinase [Roseateles depolymerans]REG21241.1 putative ATPase [Roseateles depolymerans]
MHPDLPASERPPSFPDPRRLVGARPLVDDLLPASGGIRTRLVQEPDVGLTWLIREAPLAHTAACQRLQREAQCAAQAALPSSQPPASLWLEDRLVLVHPAGEGLTTFRRLGATGVTLDTFVTLAVQAATALQTLHRAGRVHGDLRTEHCLVDPRAATSPVMLLAAVGAQAPSVPLEPGALPFRAPELHTDLPEGQTVDPSVVPTVNSDLYALGVCLFELLTGAWPLVGGTPVEWAHVHAAAAPRRASECRPDVPEVISRLLDELMAKDTAARIGSASALLAELTALQQVLKSTGSLAGWPVALPRTVADLAGAPLVGRETQQAVLASALARVMSTGDSEVVQVGGRAGSGKSTLVHTLLQEASAQGARAAYGKCDQQQRDIPFASVAQVLQALTAQLLGADGQTLATVRSRWLELLNGQGQAVVALVPAIAHVLGPTPALSNVGADQARARMEQALLQSLRAFATKDHPLVVFLDDLQWADDATAGLLEAFVQQPPPGVLLICAYRDAGVDGQLAAQVLSRMTQARHASRARAIGVTELGLPPLTETQVGDLLLAVLGQEAAADRDRLASALHRRTGGNPYFTHQLIRALLEEEVLHRDPDRGGWTCNESALANAPYSETVLDLMVHRFGRMPAQATAVAQHLASVGMACEAGLLARLSGLSAADLAEALRPVIEAGLITATSDGYAFEHDRVLESAYSLIPADRTAEVHAFVADAMLLHWQDDLTAHAFDISNQIERADGHPLEPSQRDAYVAALWRAGLQARRASAWAQTTRCIGRALQLMEERLWTEQPAVAFGVHVLHCESLLAQARLEEAGVQILQLLGRELSPLHRAAAHRLEAVLCTIRSDYEGAIDAALNGLGLLEVPLRRHPAPDEMRAAHRDTMALVQAHGGVQALADLPLTDDPRIRAAMGLLQTLLSSVFVKDGISFLHLAKMVELTVRHGATPESAHGLAWFGVECASRYEAYDDALAFGLCALSMIDRHGFESERISTLVAVDQCSVWTRPMDFALAHVQRAVQLGLASGDATMACYAYNHIVSDLLVMGRPLALVREQLDEGLELTRMMQYRDIELLLLSQQQYLETVSEAVTGAVGEALSGTASSGTGSGESHEALRPVQALRQATLQRIAEANSLPTRFWNWLYGGMALFQVGAYDEAVGLLQEADALAWSAPAHVNISDADLYLCLSLARSQRGRDDPDAVIAHLDERLPRWRRWAGAHPQTFQSKLQLLISERLRLQGRTLEAMAGFEQSALSAGAAGFVHEQALALQWAGELSLAHGLDAAALAYLREAGHAYRRWGAQACVQRLEALLLTAQRRAPTAAVSGQDAGWQAPGTPNAWGQAAWALGVSAATALSGDSVMTPLVQTLMTHLMVHAGATYGALLLRRDGDFRLTASARVVKGQVQVVQANAPPTGQSIPSSILNTVARTRQALVLADGSALPGGPAQAGREGRLRSALCMPLLRGDRLDGVIYFENGLAAGVFNEQRTAHVGLMLPQVAIALESARLYEELISESDRRLRAEMGLRSARAELVRTSHLTVLATLSAAIAHEVNQPLASIVTRADASLRWLNRAAPNIEEITAGLIGIRQDGLRAAEVIRAVRTLARQAPPQPESLSLDALLQDVLTLLSADLSARQVQVDLALAAPAPVMADRAQLQQVALNLLTNAMEAMEDVPAQRRRLRLSSVAEAGQVVVRVEDAGPGVDPALLDTIFDPFFTTKSDGLGMGLAICRSIVTSHGGTLRALRADAGGTVMSWSLPLAETPSVSPETAAWMKEQ